MDKKVLRDAREAERKDVLVDSVRLCSSAMSMPLYLAFWFADLIYAPQHKWTFLGLRSLMIPVGAFVYWAVKKAKTLRSAQYLALFFTFSNAILITIMINMTDKATSPYYAGLNLVAQGILYFFPWSKGYLPAGIFAVYAPFYTSILWNGISSSELKTLSIHSFFVASTIIVSLIIRYFNERLRLLELSSRLQLQEELKNRENIIQQKTDEGLKLAHLTKQFSPQVVHAIKSGKLSILNQVHRARISAIFIDIVNSTDRVVRIDKDDVNKVVSMFMEDTMKVLLKYDITIDKFLGDGVLGFSNDPIPHEDFVERTVNAALEIRARISARQEEYLEYWLNELQIRVGISSGFANVGFYGSEEYFKSYTAIGRVVNLASRLCSTAAPNQILASHDVIKSISETNYRFNCIGNQQLKGFESDLIKTFEIIGNQDSQKTEQQTACAIATCPHGHGVLHLDTDAHGIYVFKCHSCEYVQGQEQDIGAKKAA